MKELWVTLALGVLVCVLGGINMTGNLSTLHRYHYKRVSEENRKPFGKLVGGGTVLIGIALFLFGILSFLSEKTQNTAYLIAGSVLLVVGFVFGLGLSFYAMFKYNKGIF